MLFPSTGFLPSADPNDQLRKALLKMLMGASGSSSGSALSLGSIARGIGPDAMNARVPQLTIPAGMAALLPPGISAIPPIGGNPGLSGGGGAVHGSTPYNPAPSGGIPSVGMGGQSHPSPAPTSVAAPAPPPTQSSFSPAPSMGLASTPQGDMYIPIGSGPFRRLFGGGRVMYSGRPSGMFMS